MGPRRPDLTYVPGVDHALDQVERKLAFIERHPEWEIVFVRSMGYYEAGRDNPNTVLTSYDLKTLLDKVELATPETQEQ